MIGSALLPVHSDRVDLDDDDGRDALGFRSSSNTFSLWVSFTVWAANQVKPPRSARVLCWAGWLQLANFHTLQCDSHSHVFRAVAATQEVRDGAGEWVVVKRYLRSCLGGLHRPRSVIKLELEAHARLQHINAAQFFIPPRAYFVDGLIYPLQRGCHRMPDVSNKLAVRCYVLQLTCAVEAMHRVGVIHRQITPRNILWDPEHLTVKLIDFETVLIHCSCPATMNKYGVGAPLWFALDCGRCATTRRTYRDLCWSPAPPEVIRGSSYNYCVDIWSVGLIILSLMAGNCVLFSHDGVSEAEFSPYAAVLRWSALRCNARRRQQLQLPGVEKVVRQIGGQHLSIANTNCYGKLIAGMLEWRPESRTSAQEAKHFVTSL